jgi:NAD-dependent SIR2 family protein deacetylase
VNLNWYPKKKNNQRELCPVCSGLGKVRDKKTHLLRTCVVCNGDGLMPKKRFAKSNLNS